MAPHVAWTVLVVAMAIEAALIVSMMYVWAEYGPSSSSDAGFSELANVPRRHLEKRSAWLQRCSAAYDARDRACESFVAAARWEDRGPRSGAWMLTASHPASIAYLAAQYPDGPPLIKLLAIASSTEVGEAVVKIY